LMPLTTRVGVLDTAGDDIHGKLRVDNTVAYDPAYVLHVGLDSVMANRY